LKNGALDVSGLDDEAYLASVEAMLTAEGMAEAAELLREAETEVVETGYDNWNGGTRLYTVFLSIDPASFGRLGAKWTCPGKVESSPEVKGELDDEAATFHEGI
jgi:hypothetical protein